MSDPTATASGATENPVGRAPFLLPLPKAAACVTLAPNSDSPFSDVHVAGISVGTRGPAGAFMSHTTVAVGTRPVNVVEEGKGLIRQVREQVKELQKRSCGTYAMPYWVQINSLSTG